MFSQSGWYFGIEDVLEFKITSVEGMARTIIRDFLHCSQMFSACDSSQREFADPYIIW